MDDQRKYFSKRKPVKCPACGVRKIVGILYGFPSEEGMNQARSRRLILGGCCISGSDPSWQCTGCGAQIYREELKRTTDNVEAIFNATFSHWNIRLLKEDLEERKRGKINKAGWAIWYLFGMNEKGEYLDYYASHRMTNDRHIRIYFDGSSEGLDAIQDLRAASKDPVEDAKLDAEFSRENQRVAAILKEKGFGIAGDEPWSVQVNRYLLVDNPKIPRKRK